MELRPGTQLGPYRVEASIARGGMGAIYRAQCADGAAVALKVLLSRDARPDQRARFEREAQLAARLAHPGIVRVLGAGEHQGLRYIAMDLVDGEPLTERCGRVPPLEAARLVAQVARAIEHAHTLGVLHRDLKPQNVLVRPDGTALVTDFGVARALEEESSLTKTGALVGTPLYMAPEQATGGPTTTATDVHGLGVLLYEVLTGVSPFAREDMTSIMVAITTAAPDPPSALRPEVSPALDRLCLAALTKNPALRPSAGDLATSLEGVVATSATRRPPRRALLLGAGSLVALGALAVALVVAPPAPPPSTTPPTATRVAPAPIATAATPRPDPPWSAQILAGDLESLRLAVAAATPDSVAASDATVRARVVKRLERLDASWRSPVGVGWQAKTPDTDEGRRELQDETERLVLIHRLHQVVDPTHRLPKPQLDLIGGLLLICPTMERARYRSILGSMTDLAPEDARAYLFYTRSGDMGALDERILRRGLNLVPQDEDDPTWEALSVALGHVLLQRIRAGDRAPERRVELEGLVAQALERVDRAPAAASALLFLAVQEALHRRSHEDGLRHIEAALGIDRTSSTALSLRTIARVLGYENTRDEGLLALAAADHATLLARASDETQGDLALASGHLLSCYEREERWDDALALIDRVLEVLTIPWAEAALKRVVLLARRRPALRPTLELESLVLEVEARRDFLERHALLRDETREQLEHLLRLARDASSLLARGELDRGKLADALDEHPAKRLLFTLDPTPP